MTVSVTVRSVSYGMANGCPAVSDGAGSLSTLWKSWSSRWKAKRTLKVLTAQVRTQDAAFPALVCEVGSCGVPCVRDGRCEAWQLPRQVGCSLRKWQSHTVDYMT